MALSRAPMPMLLVGPSLRDRDDKLTPPPMRRETPPEMKPEKKHGGKRDEPRKDNACNMASRFHIRNLGE